IDRRAERRERPTKASDLDAQPRAERVGRAACAERPLDEEPTALCERCGFAERLGEREENGACRERDRRAAQAELVTTRTDHELGTARERRNVGERGERDRSVADEARDRR